MASRRHTRHAWLPTLLVLLGIQRYFRVTPPTVHAMIVKLEQNGLIHRKPGLARTLEVLVTPAQLPELR